MIHAITTLADLLFKTAEKFAKQSNTELDGKVITSTTDALTGQDEPTEEEIKQGFAQAEALYFDDSAPTLQEQAEQFEAEIERLVHDANARQERADGRRIKQTAQRLSAVLKKQDAQKKKDIDLTVPNKPKRKLDV